MQEVLVALAVQQQVAPASGSTASSSAGSTASSSSASGSTSSSSSSSSTAKNGSSTTTQSTASASEETTTVKSSNNYLQSITLSSGTLSPEFYRETFEYTVEDLDESITEIEVSAVAEDERATISGLGTVALAEGKNQIEISVTAENESVRKYTIVINREETLKQSDLRLQTLDISTINRDGEFSELDISFDKEVFEYTVNVAEDIEDLDVNPSVEREGIIVEVEGEKNLVEDENIVTITLTSQDDTEMQTQYIIKVNREAAVQTVASSSENDESSKIVAICVMLAILVVEAGLFIWMQKKKRK